MRKKRAGVVKNVFACDICNKSGFRSSYSLKAHLFVHKMVPPRYSCSFCPKEFFRTDEWARHMATHTRTQKIHICDHCDREFVDKRNLILHLRIHDDLPRLSNLRFKCSACNANYCEARLLKYHIRKEHLNLTSNESVHVHKKINDTWIENIKNTKSCVQITKIKSNVLSIQRCKIKCQIVGKEKEIKPFQKFIESIYARDNSFYSKAICDYCNKEMLKKSIINHIRERHLKIRRFSCDVCHRTFMRHYQLCDHICGKDNRRRKIKVEK